MTKKLSRDEMIVALKESVCRVVFTKVNGEERDTKDAEHDNADDD